LETVGYFLSSLTGLVSIAVLSVAIFGAHPE
jgi:hypothetical protein